MNIFYGLLIAVSMYSKIPVPVVDWTKPRLRYAMCWFPVVGVVCGGLLWGWYQLAARLQISWAAAGLAGTCIPILVTGGIHLDGLLDTVDAKSSYGDRKKKLAILADPHVGAFAIIGGSVYLLLYAACLIQLFTDGAEAGQGRLVAAFCLVFPLERAFSGLSVACFPCAKESGLAHTFSDGAHKKAVRIVLALWALALSLFLLDLGMVAAAAALLPVVLCFWYYREMAKKVFGGITGDLAGWFLQTAELAALAALAVCARWMAL